MQRFFKKCAAFVIRNIASHGKALAQEVVKANGLQALANILSEFDPSVKEAACWAISYIAKYLILTQTGRRVGHSDHRSDSIEGSCALHSRTRTWPSPNRL
jgi:hypothetical protein